MSGFWILFVSQPNYAIVDLETCTIIKLTGNFDAVASYGWGWRSIRSIEGFPQAMHPYCSSSEQVSTQIETGPSYGTNKINIEEHQTREARLKESLVYMVEDFRVLYLAWSAKAAIGHLLYIDNFGALDHWGLLIIVLAIREEPLIISLTISDCSWVDAYCIVCRRPLLMETTVVTTAIRLSPVAVNDLEITIERM